MATRLPCGMMCRYLDRVPERLVLEGYRRWMQGCDRGSSTCWEMASSLFNEELGPFEGGRLLGELAHWVEALRGGMDRQAGLSPFECKRLCRDECIVVAMIAASQNHDTDALSAAVDALILPENRAEAIRASRAFADALSKIGQTLIPVPSAVFRDVAERPARAQFH
jgi:hypothetical protein